MTLYKLPTITRFGLTHPLRVLKGIHRLVYEELRGQVRWATGLRSDSLYDGKRLVARAWFSRKNPDKIRLKVRKGYDTSEVKRVYGNAG